MQPRRGQRDAHCAKCDSTSYTWAFVVYVGRDRAGRRKQHFRSGFPSAAEAARARREVLRKRDGNRFVEPSIRTLGEFLIEEWLPAMRARLRESTWESYAGELQRNVVPHLGQVPLQQINAVQLNGLYAQLLLDGRRDGKGGLSPRSVRYVHMLIRKALKDAVRWQMLEQNPSDFADPPRLDPVAGIHGAVWTPDELARFLKQAREERLYACWRLPPMTGMRRGEVLGLAWPAVDLDARRLTVVQTLIMAGGQVRLSRPKTRRSRRVIDLDPGTVEALTEWRNQQQAESAEWGPAWSNESGLVFTREDGSPLRPDSWGGSMFQRLCDEAGVPRIPFKNQRHTHATHLLAAGIPPKEVSYRLGHHSTGFTQDVYADRCRVPAPRWRPSWRGWLGSPRAT